MTSETYKTKMIYLNAQKSISQPRAQSLMNKKLRDTALPQP